MVTVIVEIVAALVYLGIRTGIQVIITVRRSQAVDTLGEQVHFKGNSHCGECLPQGEGVAGIVAVGLPDEKGRSDRARFRAKGSLPDPLQERNRKGWNGIILKMCMFITNLMLTIDNT